MSSFQKEEKKMQRIGYKVGILVAWLLGINIIIIVLLCIFMFQGLSTEMLQNECISGTNTLSYYLKEFPDIDDKTKLLDDLKQQTGYEFTIFENDVRTYTTVKQNGTRATGTKLSSEIAEIVLEQGKTYIGVNTILDVKHICSYVPIQYQDGTKGIIFSGIPKTKAAARLNMTILLSCVAGIILIIFSVLILTVYLKRAVSYPLSKLTDVAKTMERGELNFEGNHDLNMHSNDEIGILSHSFESTRIRLNDYIGEISNILEAMSKGDLTVSTTQNYIGDFVSIKQSLNDIVGNLNSTTGFKWFRTNGDCCKCIKSRLCGTSKRYRRIRGNNY